MKPTEGTEINQEYISYTVAPKTILPLILPIVKPQSVTDWGCNRGFWLEECKNSGINKIHGFDMCEYDADFRIPKKDFTQVNFEEKSPQKKADLGIWLENVEHISPIRADELHESICKSCDTVLFSGATPGQGGDEHVNERPHSYWHSKFAHAGFLLLDAIRWSIIDNPNIFSWYQGNTFLYTKIPLPRQ
jgi:hypothetical protein